ncbi:MAG TPA: hypothetical protein VM266_00820 [Solirubrobacteraceae bacterium]|nr:hypothetical protein [Solirubrobacteraceae bacterium]
MALAAAGLDVTLTATAPLRGVVRCGDLEPRPFEGWVALAAAVEACVAEQARRAAATATG